VPAGLPGRGGRATYRPSRNSGALRTKAQLGPANHPEFRDGPHEGGSARGRRRRRRVLSTGRHEFYQRLGWERWLGPTFVRRGEALVRTPDEDDGIMVLRFGRSRDTDLTAPIACEAREGDDW